jgi:hypothetical protein
MIGPSDRGWGHGGGPLHAAVIYDSEGSLQTRVAPFLRAGLDRGEAILAVVPSGAERVAGGEP